MHLNAVNFLLLIAAALCRPSLAATSQHQPQPPADNVGTSCIPHERDALLAFKQGITEDPCGLLDTWQRGRGNGGEDDCCQWRGVRCSNRTGHVLKLRLRNVEYGSTGLVGQISDSLLSLNHLAHLDLSMNYLDGLSSHIPAFLGSMANLRYLNLSGITFSRVPPHLGNLSKLQYLDLSHGQGMYSTDISWLEGLPVLQYLSMSMVDLSKIVDWPNVVNMIPSLKVLDLSGCLLTSANQSIQRINLTNLEKLDLSHNNFDNPMASSWFWNLTGLQYLNLESTFLEGEVPDALGDLTSLQVFDLSSNLYLGMMTTSLKKLCNLIFLDLNGCILYGNMEEFTDLLPHCPLNKLQKLYLRDNNFTGILPSHMTHFTSLVVLDLSGNKLSGHVPSEIGMLANLTSLDLSYNNFYGDITEKHFVRLEKLKRLDLSGNSLRIRVSSEWIPPFDLEEASLAYCQIGPLFPAWLQFQVNLLRVDISSSGVVDKLPDWFSTTFSNATLDLSQNSLSGNLPLKLGTPYLSAVSLFSNYFTGSLESICELKMLYTLNLGSNLFEGEIPQCFPSNLMYLLLSNNSFSGDFPPFLQSFMQLEFLDLSQNKFSGKLPQWIGSGLVGLWYLRLSENMFSGNIPTSITNLSHLYQLDLGSNMLSGAIPQNLSSLTAMTQKYMDSNFYIYPYGGGDDMGAYYSAVIKGRELYYDIRIFQTVNIDLSFNHLSGGIPEEIASLDGLINLNLSSNHLSGEVPDKIGVMKLLESLDLSINMLSGEIPSSLSNLSSLSYLDLSNNNLTGRIPSGQQLDTLYAEYPFMYSGNSGLCGPPIQKMCPGNNASRQDVQSSNEHGFEAMKFYFGLGLGFMLGLWVVFCTLLFKNAWRTVYFRLIDSIYDQIYVFLIVAWKSLAREGSTD